MQEENIADRKVIANSENVADSKVIADRKVFYGISPMENSDSEYKFDYTSLDYEQLCEIFGG